MKLSASNHAEQRARMELLSSAGAALLGAGFALVFRQVLAPLAIPLLVIGGLTHACAMYAKHRLDLSAEVSLSRWMVYAYWACWLLVGLLLVYVVAARV